MTEEAIVKTAKRTRYPWKSLTEVGSHFIIDAANENGVKNIRQLIYSANQSAKNKQSSVRFQFHKQPETGNIVVERVQ